MCTVCKGEQAGDLHRIEVVGLPAKFALHMGLPVTCRHRGIGFLAAQ